MKKFLTHIKSLGFLPTRILDVGAHKASWSQLAKSVFPDAQFCLIDPLVELEHNLKAFCDSTKNSSYYLAAAGANEEKITICFNPDKLDGTSCIPIEGTQQREVKKIKLDNLPFRNPELVKLDVQGFELEALKGFENTMASPNKPQMFILEVSLFHFEPTMPDFFEVVYFMKQRGYVVYDFAGFLLRPFDNALGQCDICFVLENGIFKTNNYWDKLPVSESKPALISLPKPTQIPIRSQPIAFKTVCLSLLKSRQTPNPRRELFTAQAQKFGIEFEFFTATSKEKYNKVNFTESKDPYSGHYHNLASYAHNLDLATILEQCLHDGTEMLLFMEDDCILQPQAWELFNYALQYDLPQNFDVFYIGAQHKQKPIPIHAHFGKATCGYQSHCVLIHVCVMPMLIYFCRKNTRLFDVVLAEIVNPLGKSYCLIPDMAHQADGYSDMWEKEIKQSER